MWLRGWDPGIYGVKRIWEDHFPDNQIGQIWNQEENLVTRFIWDSRRFFGGREESGIDSIWLLSSFSDWIWKSKERPKGIQGTGFVFIKTRFSLMIYAVRNHKSQLVGKGGDMKNGEGIRKRLKIYVPHLDNSDLIKSYSMTLTGRYWGSHLNSGQLQPSREPTPLVRQRRWIWTMARFVW
ncbi:hypothetical protein IGI04_026687 [Brassica rapa subsp. trilocularis]|uniref:Uncharacterized protein n=1 Tax=Brassica rapa subsp. trilocularis TaxID=1813537 RepID=A0ABQ7KZC8_BRACM|nr:hypothetical protein IGI04_026687 [Brassica rapa subsp. trilocularis]